MRITQPSDFWTKEEDLSEEVLRSEELVDQQRTPAELSAYFSISLPAVLISESVMRIRIVMSWNNRR